VNVYIEEGQVIDMTYRIHTTKRFDKEIEKLSEEENKRINNTE